MWQDQRQWAQEAAPEHEEMFIASFITLTYFVNVVVLEHLAQAAKRECGVSIFGNVQGPLDVVLGSWL